ncbi:MAG TPA: hydroxyacid dehydrogenase [Candidatus Limnocylindrales bacterium]
MAPKNSRKDTEAGMSFDRPQLLLAMSGNAFRQLFGAEPLARLESLAALGTPRAVESFGDSEALQRLSATEVLLTGWGCPPLDARVLAHTPRLRAVIHTAGSVKSHITDACWDRGLVISSAADANAIPVAEYTLAAILGAGKRIPAYAAGYREHAGRYAWRETMPESSNYQRTVGVVGFSRVGRRVVQLLRPFDLDVLVADPYADPEDVASCGGTLLELDDLLARSEIVSLHAPELPSTYQMINAKRLAMLADHATLINTARGSLVDTEALTAECLSGRLFAVLDVTDPEPLPAESPLYRLSNVVLTPHIAGALHGETRRLVQLALDELDRFTRGAPLRHQIHRSSLPRIA